jgi:hypothetical protein
MKRSFKLYKKSLEVDYEKLNSSKSDSMELNEAKFSTNNMRKVSDLLAKIASKKLGGNFSFAWTDQFKKSSGRIGNGMRYVSADGQQIRFNNVNTSATTYAINSVDYWRKGDGFTEPSISLYFADRVNIVKLTDELFSALKTGKVTPLRPEDLTESLEESAKEKRQQFAQANDIPASYTVSNTAMKKKVDKMGLTAAYTEWMEVRTGDSEKTSFDAQLTESQKKLTDNNFYADPKYVFEDMKVAAMTVAKGYWRSLIIAGQGGIGKTFGVKEVLTQNLGPYSEGYDAKWMFYEGLKVSPLGLFNLLLLNKKKLIVFDDSDSIFTNNDMTNMMKIATSDSGDRTISWVSKATANVALMNQEERKVYEMDYIEAMMEDPNTNMKAPSSFNFEGRIIVISNMPASKFDKAIKSRSIFIDLYLAKRDTLRRMATIMEFEGDSPEEIMEILEAADPDAADALAGKGKFAGEIQYMTPDQARKNKQLNMRTIGIIKALRKSGHPDWRRMGNLYS